MLKATEERSQALRTDPVVHLKGFGQLGQVRADGSNPVVDRVHQQVTHLIQHFRDPVVAERPDDLPTATLQNIHLFLASVRGHLGFHLGVSQRSDRFLHGSRGFHHHRLFLGPVLGQCFRRCHRFGDLRQRFLCRLLLSLFLGLRFLLRLCLAGTAAPFVAQPFHGVSNMDLFRPLGDVRRLLLGHLFAQCGDLLLGRLDTGRGAGPLRHTVADRFGVVELFQPPFRLSKFRFRLFDLRALGRRLRPRGGFGDTRFRGVQGLLRLQHLCFECVFLPFMGPVDQVLRPGQLIASHRHLLVQRVDGRQRLRPFRRVLLLLEPHLWVTAFELAAAGQYRVLRQLQPGLEGMAVCVVPFTVGVQLVSVVQRCVVGVIGRILPFDNGAAGRAIVGTHRFATEVWVTRVATAESILAVLRVAATPFVQVLFPV